MLTAATPRVAWRDLPKSAMAFRLAHVLYSVVGLASLGAIWWSAWTRRRNYLVGGAATFLIAEGGALVVGRGNCPFRDYQASLGDPVPLFALVLPPRAAKAAIPILAFLSIAGLAAMAVRQPRSLRLSAASTTLESLNGDCHTTRVARRKDPCSLFAAA